MYRINFILGPDENLLRQSLNTLLAALTMIDVAELKAHPEIPLLYKSGVRFFSMPVCASDWQDVLTTRKVLVGDVETLACWRAAELQVRGVDAWPTASLFRTADGQLSSHPVVRLPDGTFEDPAKILGWKGPDPAHKCTGLGNGPENKATFIVDLFYGQRELDLSHRVLTILLHALFVIDLNYLRAHPNTPRLYTAGVVYNEEPPDREDWQDIPTNLRRKDADCEDLATHRAAELNVLGNERGQIIQAWPMFAWKQRTNGSMLYHIQVRYPDGTIEDPSIRLGMGT